jgi:nicotinamide mononucleotide adenylyltransferase
MNNKETETLGLIIGRFQPLTKAHLDQLFRSTINTCVKRMQ